MRWVSSSHEEHELSVDLNMYKGKHAPRNILTSQRKLDFSSEACSKMDGRLRIQPQQNIDGSIAILAGGILDS